MEDIDSPLMPFACDGRGTLHTARTAQHTSDLGYAYAGVQHLDLTAMELAAKVSQIVKDLYGHGDLWEDP